MPQPLRTNLLSTYVKPVTLRFPGKQDEVQVFVKNNNLNFITDKVTAEYIRQMLLSVQPLSHSGAVSDATQRFKRRAYFTSRNEIENCCLGKEV
jgi:hypothetical protein